MMTPYEQHEKQGHGPMTRSSPDGFQIIEECEDCGGRWLHDPLIGYPVTLTGSVERYYKGIGQ